MANTRGGQAPKRARQASKSKESGSSAPAKRRSHRIAAGTSKRACKPGIKTTITIPNSPSVSSLSFDNSASTQSATKTTANGVFFESIVKSVKITLSRTVLESIFGLKFVDTATHNLSRKVAKDLCLPQFARPQKLETYTWQNKAPPIMFCTPNIDCCTMFLSVFSIPKPTPKKLIMSDLTPEEASSLKIKLPDTASAPAIADTLTELKDDHADIRTHLEHI
ncbi:hypothetical protein Cgig2_018957 [Carnegiea gigantea]|uniref:Uncharacterized protein n=1 Tax=Carnegiea gigantea TaxID=171969 RepID=A0A9Q1GM91_9CARY|nr:hypothetical protein Cgig2_018957 [Carnegiea gigantea]